MRLRAPDACCSVQSSSGLKRLAELEKSINARTAMLFFLNRYEPLGQIKRQDWMRAGKEHGVPVFNDAAADVPPAGAAFGVLSTRVSTWSPFRAARPCAAPRPRACWWAGPI